MKKAVEKRYYNKEDTMYLSMLGNSIIGLFKSDGTQISLAFDKYLDMGKIIFNHEVYLVRTFKRKGYCLVFKIENNDINLKKSQLFALHTQNINYVNLWEDIDF